MFLGFLRHHHAKVYRGGDRGLLAESPGLPFLRVGPVIPWQVAPQQSLPPFDRTSPFTA